LKKPEKASMVLVVLFLTIFSTISAQEEARITTILAEADQHIAQNQLAEALTKTQEVLKISSVHIGAMEKQINILFLMNNNKEALKLADDAIAIYPEVGDFFYLRGIIYNALGKYVRALDDFNMALNLQPVDELYKFYLGRGVAYMNLLEYDKALADFSKSIELNDTVASAYHGRAMVNYEIKDYAAAVNDFLKTLDYSAGNAVIFFNLGMSYFRMEDKEKACPYFHKACTMGNNNACRMALMECAKAIPAIP
jgi:tetratricopeptide (TPR) repeat protein